MKSGHCVFKVFSTISASWANMARRILPRPAGSCDSSSIPSIGFPATHSQSQTPYLPGPVIPQRNPSWFPLALIYSCPLPSALVTLSPFLLLECVRPVPAQHLGPGCLSSARMLLPELLADSLPHIIRVPVSMSSCPSPGPPVTLISFFICLHSTYS